MTVWVSTKLPQELAERVQDLALAERRSYAQMVAMLCEEALAVRRQTANPYVKAVGGKYWPTTDHGESLQPGGDA